MQSLIMLIIVSQLLINCEKILAKMIDNKLNRHVFRFFKETLWLE